MSNLIRIKLPIQEEQVMISHNDGDIISIVNVNHALKPSDESRFIGNNIDEKITKRLSATTSLKRTLYFCLLLNLLL